MHHGDAWSRRSDKPYLVSAGEIRFVLDGEAFVMTAGDFCCVARGRRFSYANHGSDVATLVIASACGGRRHTGGQRRGFRE